MSAPPLGAPLGMGMAGGGPGSFIGPIHRMAAELDGRARLVLRRETVTDLLSLEVSDV